MDRATYDALTASVEKWRKNAAGPALDGAMGSNNCPLCFMFIWADCQGCPVFQATGQEECGGSPYYAAYRARRDVVIWGAPQSAWQSAAQEEADFLAALVPAGGPDA